MRETDWTPARGAKGALIARPGLTARARSRIGQTLISGDLAAALAELAPGAPFVGLYGPAPGWAYALRIAPDKALLVTPAPIRAAEGWREGWAATPVDDGWVALDVKGAQAPLVLMQATAADLGRARRRRPSCSPACAACWPAPKRVSACMSSGRGSRRC